MNTEKIISWFDCAMTFSFYALIYFIPISIALVEICASVIILLYFLKRGVRFYGFLKGRLKQRPPLSSIGIIKTLIKSFKPVKNDLNWPLGIFILSGFLSIIVSKYPILSIKGFFFKLLENTFLYFLFIECINTKKRLKIFVSIFLTSATLVFLSGLLQPIIKIDFIRGHLYTLDPVTSSFPHPNDLAAYLIIVSMLYIAFALFYPLNKLPQRINQSKTFAVSFRTLFILPVICLALTYSRGAWIAFFMSLILLGILRPKTFPTCLAIIAVFAVVFFQNMEKVRNISFEKDNPSELYSSVVKAQESQESLLPLSEKKSEKILVPPLNPNTYSPHESLIALNSLFDSSGRGVLWKASIDIIRKFPFGIGLNNYSRIAHEHNVYWSGYPHNCYLQLTAEMGFIGFFAFVWTYFVLFKNAIFQLRFMKDDFLIIVLLGSLTGLFGFLAHSFVDTNFYSVQLGNFMWLVTGLVVASQKIEFNR